MLWGGGGLLLALNSCEEGLQDLNDLDFQLCALSVISNSQDIGKLCGISTEHFDSLRVGINHVTKQGKSLIKHISLTFIEVCMSKIHHKT